MSDIAHLGPVELLTPDFDRSLAFFVDVLGMEIEGEEGDSVFLRGWGDYQRYSLQLTASAASGMASAASPPSRPPASGRAGRRARAGAAPRTASAIRTGTSSSSTTSAIATTRPSTWCRR